MVSLRHEGRHAFDREAQLQGAVKRLQAGVEILERDNVIWNGRSESFQRVHAIVSVSNTSFDLPWDVIGVALAAAQCPPSIYYHLLPVAEIQQIVTFVKGSAVEMDNLLVRRAEIIMGSKNALIAPEFLPRLPTKIDVSKASAESLGLRLAWTGGEEMVDWLRILFSSVKRAMAKRRVSGRVDYFNVIGILKGKKAMGVGIAINCLDGELHNDWWEEFRAELVEGLQKEGAGPIPGSVAIQRVSLILQTFKDHLLVCQFEDGVLIAEADPDTAHLS